MAFRFMVRNLRNGEWMVLDEHRDTAGEEPLTRNQYVTGMYRARPLLHQRECMVEEFDAPVAQSIPLGKELSQSLNRLGDALA